MERKKERPIFIGLFLRYIEQNNMPAVTPSQQRLFAQAYEIKIGELDPSDLNPKYRDEIVDLSKRMTKRQLKDFASTKYKDMKEGEQLGKVGDIEIGGVKSNNIPVFNPKGPGKIIPFLDPDAKQKKKGKRNLQNLKDYRDWCSSK